MEDGSLLFQKKGLLCLCYLLHFSFFKFGPRKVTNCREHRWRGEQRKLLAEQELQGRRGRGPTLCLKGSENRVKSCQQPEYELRKVTLQK